MPLSLKGKKIKYAMEKRYGKKKGEQVFFAWENKQHGKSRRKKRR